MKNVIIAMLIIGAAITGSALSQWQVLPATAEWTSYEVEKNGARLFVRLCGSVRRTLPDAGTGPEVIRDCVVSELTGAMRTHALSDGDALLQRWKNQHDVP